jgi:site-specific DNA recombinase
MRIVPVSRPSRIAIYARYSSDLQNPTSVEDQVALCRHLARDHFAAEPSQLSVYFDAAISGATMQRSDIRRLLADASAERFDLVIAEGLDRVSRNLRDIAGIYEILKFHRIGMWTAHEGHITELHIAFKGAMNALYLEDMGDKMRRGQSARIAGGFALSACPYGYRITRGVVDERGRNVNGVREIDPEQAVIVRRIFQEFASGRGVREILDGLIADGVPWENGRPWLWRSILGRAIFDEGILRNEMYLGRLVYNKRVTQRDPTTGKKRYRVQPRSAWTRVEVPHLRIVSDDLWQAVRARLDTIAQPSPPKRKLPLNMTTHNQRPLTGWVRCGACGATKSIANSTRYVCNSFRFEKVCRNGRGTREGVLLDAVFSALLERINFGADFRPQMVRVFAQQADRSGDLSAEEADIAAQIERYMDAIGAGVDKKTAIERILDLQNRLKDVREELGRMMLPNLPTEAGIRSRLRRAVMELRASGAITDQRAAFGLLLDSITLTPIAGEPQGETISLKLREEGWPEFWRSIA